MMPIAGIMIRKLFIVGLVLAACLELSQGKPSPQAKITEDYVKALTQIQGVSMHTDYVYSNTSLIREQFESSLLAIGIMVLDIYR